MSTFLLELAEHLRNSYKNDLSKLVVMFPSLRARAFFNDALSSVSQDTIWQPHYTSIDEVMERASGLKRVDQIRLLGECIYICYKVGVVRYVEVDKLGVECSNDCDIGL